MNGEQFEITTYRIDGEYKDNRHPDNVSFSDSLKEDLARRDFTVNAMCYNRKDGLTDLYSGREHLEKRLICAVGEAERRFDEDALRILRAMRFASVLNFNIEQSTAEAIRKKKKLLKNVSRERIYVEWKKLIGGVGAYKILSEYKEVIAEIIPSLCELKLPSEERFAVACEDARVLSLFALSAENPEDAFFSAYCALKPDKAIRELGHKVLSNYKNPIESVKAALLLLNKTDKQTAYLTVELRNLLGFSDGSEAKVLEEALQSGIPYRIGDLRIGGKELLAHGFCGKDIGQALEKLLHAVIDGRVKNEREQLLSFLS